MIPDRFARLPCLLLALTLTACTERSAERPPPAAATAAASAAQPPVAARREHPVTAPHGAVRMDEYHWLRDDSRESPEVLAYLEAENAYTDTVMAPLEPLRARLYDELVGRVKQDDASVPFRWKGYWYYSRFEQGREYPIHARRKGGMDAPEEILLDLNALAEGHDFYSVGNYKVSLDGRWLVFAEDTLGRLQYTLRFRDLETGEFLPDALAGSSGDVVWAADNASVFYIENDPVTLRTLRVKRYTLGAGKPASRR